MMSAQPDVSLKLAIIYLALHILGWGYNALIGHFETHKHLEGYTAESVVIGVLFTLTPFVIFDHIELWWIFVAFVASGSPMIIGAWWRHVSARAAAQKAMRDD